MDRKIAVITGGSRGIGLETAKELSKSCTVYELSRRGESHDGITHISADVSDENGVAAAIDTIVEKREESIFSYAVRVSGYPAPLNLRIPRTQSTSST